MAEIFKFKKEAEEHDCPVCDLVEEYFDSIVDAKNEDELRYLLSEMANNASTIFSEEDFEAGYKYGYKEALRTDVELKIKLLDSFEEDECACDGCHECADGECDC